MCLQDVLVSLPVAIVSFQPGTIEKLETRHLETNRVLCQETSQGAT